MLLGAQIATTPVTAAQFDAITRRHPDALIVGTAAEWSVEVDGQRFVVARVVSAA